MCFPDLLRRAELAIITFGSLGFANCLVARFPARNELRLPPDQHVVAAKPRELGPLVRHQQIVVRARAVRVFGETEALDESFDELITSQFIVVVRDRIQGIQSIVNRIEVLIECIWVIVVQKLPERLS